MKGPLSLMLEPMLRNECEVNGKPVTEDLLREAGATASQIEAWRRRVGSSRIVDPATVQDEVKLQHRPQPKPLLMLSEFTQGDGWAMWVIGLKLDRRENTGVINKAKFGLPARQRLAVFKALAPQLAKLAWFQEQIAEGSRLLCTITRCGPGTLDEGDNLEASAKHIRDAVAMILAVDDNKHGPITWDVQQSKGDRWGVRIRIEKESA